MMQWVELNRKDIKLVDTLETVRESSNERWELSIQQVRIVPGQSRSFQLGLTVQKFLVQSRSRDEVYKRGRCVELVSVDTVEK